MIVVATAEVQGADLQRGRGHGLQLHGRRVVCGVAATAGSPGFCPGGALGTCRDL